MLTYVGIRFLRSRYRLYILLTMLILWFAYSEFPKHYNWCMFANRSYFNVDIYCYAYHKVDTRQRACSETISMICVMTDGCNAYLPKNSRPREKISRLYIWLRMLICLWRIACMLTLYKNTTPNENMLIIYFLNDADLCMKNLLKITIDTHELIWSSQTQTYHKSNSRCLHPNVP